MKLLRSRKGITITEVVVALAIIAAISAITLTMIVRSDDVEARTENAMLAENTAQNAIECYRFVMSKGLEAAAVPAEFYRCLAKTGAYVRGTVRAGAFTEEMPDPAAGERDVFRLAVDRCVVLIEMTGDGFVYTAKNVQDEVIYSFTYPDGGVS